MIAKEHEQKGKKTDQSARIRLILKTATVSILISDLR